MDQEFKSQVREIQTDCWDFQPNAGLGFPLSTVNTMRLNFESQATLSLAFEKWATRRSSGSSSKQVDEFVQQFMLTNLTSRSVTFDSLKFAIRSIRADLLFSTGRPDRNSN